MLIIEEMMVKKQKKSRIFHHKTDRLFYFKEKFTTFIVHKDPIDDIHKVSKRFYWQYSWQAGLTSGSLFDLFREKVYGSLKDQAKLKKGRGNNPLNKWQKRSKHIQKRKQLQLQLRK